MSDTEILRELRGLVAEWEEFAENNSDWNDYNQGVHEATQMCSNQIQEVIEKHE